jgi:hypothetical protein
VTTITADYFRSAALPTFSFSAGTSRDFQEVKRAAIAGDAASTLPARAFADLARVAHECANERWDGYNAKAISVATCERVRAFLSDLPVWMPAPDVVPEADGEVAIEWYVAPNQTLSISIGEAGPLHYAGLFGNNEEQHGVAQFIGSVPERISQLISDLLNSPAARRAT